MSFLERVKNALLYEFKSESEMVDAIKTISSNFTKNRESIAEYVKDRKLVSAYACFYFTTNLPKLGEVLHKIRMSEEKYSEYEIVDIGTGPGTFVLASLAINNDQEIYGVESSDLMREQALKLIEEFHPDRSIKLFSNITQVPRREKNAWEFLDIRPMRWK